MKYIIGLVPLGNINIPFLLDVCSNSNSTLMDTAFTPESRKSKTWIGQVKIMKVFFWMDRFFFLNLAFGQVGEKTFDKKTVDNQATVSLKWS